MKTTTKIIAASLVTMGLVGAGSAAFAATQADPKITKEQAVKIAQDQVPGSALTDSEHERGHWDVEVTKDNVEHDFEIDDQNGKVLEHDTDTPDAADTDDDSDDANDDD
ncbi:PepSY domain-containing protein [Nonomuraea soli]|uniref:Putative membrane protein YkoI n=1 Tax=Nonomuraea soli TaxID=1032476 RepID=A0A7W0HN11_9ACTN|nr:PepSY domain-containing protein [Nonomuraea soli]MBA2889016.1 putative membrane protein YkoI [Nonomuraea soli]